MGRIQQQQQQQQQQQKCKKKESKTKDERNEKISFGSSFFLDEIFFFYLKGKLGTETKTQKQTKEN